MTPEGAFRALLRALAGLYDGEGRAGGREVAAMLRDGAETARVEPGAVHRLDAAIRAATSEAEHPAAVLARAAHEVLPWRATAISEGNIPGAVSEIFAVAPLVGPGAVIPSETCRAGLFVQVADAFYPPHAHSAEETYIMLAGRAEWQRDLGAWASRGPGETIHHPSEAPHATRTGAQPMLATWRWSGDVRAETYRMVGGSG